MINSSIPERIGLSMDGGHIYKLHDNKYIKIVVQPHDDIVGILSKKSSIHEALYYVSEYRIPKSWKCRMFIETYDYHTRKILPSINQFHISQLSFDNIIYEDDDFILANDVKYTDNTHYYIIYVKSDIRSIRDLNQLHLELLKNIRKIAIKYISKIENVSQSSIRLYVHYYPSIWRLHIHVNLIKDKFESTSIDYSHKLSDIIENIQICPDYYQKVNLQTIDRYTPITVDYFVDMYLKRYLPVKYNNDFQYQESLRLKDAYMYKKDKSLMLNGKFIYDIIVQTYNDSNISDQFKNFIKDNLNLGLKNDNYRCIVRKILMYPLFEYPNFNRYEIDIYSILKRAGKFVCIPSIQKIEGRIFCVIEGFNDHMWRKDIDLMIDMNISKHVQPQDRIHLINSDIVNMCDKDKLDVFLDRYKQIKYDLEMIDVSHTYSMDWSPISICVVINIRSKILYKFIEDFKEEFGFFDMRYPSLHRTIGVIYR